MIFSPLTASASAGLHFPMRLVTVADEEIVRNTAYIWEYL